MSQFSVPSAALQAAVDTATLVMQVRRWPVWWWLHGQPKRDLCLCLA